MYIIEYVRGKESPVSHKIRKQIYLEPAQDRLLKQRAQEWGISEAELIRRCLDTLGQQTMPLPLDPQAWADELAFLQHRAQTVPSRNERRGWTREELYAERLDRVLP
jgi:hypothetical protein